MKNLAIILLTTLLYSCTGNIENTWVVDNFETDMEFVIETKKGKTYNTAIITVTGNVNEDVCFKLALEEDDNWCKTFTSNDSEIQFKTDFYGVGTFKLYMISSNANGKIKINIRIPYTM